MGFLVRGQRRAAGDRPRARLIRLKTKGLSAFAWPTEHALTPGFASQPSELGDRGDGLPRL